VSTTVIVKLDLSDVAKKVVEVLNERYARVGEEELLGAEIITAEQPKVRLDL